MELGIEKNNNTNKRNHRFVFGGVLISLHLRRRHVDWCWSIESPHRTAPVKERTPGRSSTSVWGETPHRRLSIVFLCCVLFFLGFFLVARLLGCLVRDGGTSREFQLRRKIEWTLLRIRFTKIEIEAKFKEKKRKLRKPDFQTRYLFSRLSHAQRQSKQKPRRGVFSVFFILLTFRFFFFCRATAWSGATCATRASCTPTRRWSWSCSGWCAPDHWSPNSSRTGRARRRTAASTWCRCSATPSPCPSRTRSAAQTTTTTTAKEWRISMHLDIVYDSRFGSSLYQESVKLRCHQRLISRGNRIECGSIPFF